MRSERSLQRVVIDSNVWVSGFGWPGSVPGKILELVGANELISLISDPILEEIERTLTSPRIGFDPRRAEGAVALARRSSTVVEPSMTLAVITAKESDNRVLECAVAGGADLIVTGDRKHLLPLGAYEGIRILAPVDLLRELLLDS